MDIFNGKKAIIKIEITKDDNYASLSDNDVINYSLYDLEGNIVDDIENKKIDVSDLSDKTMIYIEIPGEANIIPSGKTFDSRILIVEYTLDEVKYSLRKNYRVVPFVPYVCNADDVRSLLGVSSTMIEDSAIDIYGGYLKCKSLFEDSSTLDNLLLLGNQQTTLANRAISICSALAFKLSLALIVPKIESDGVTSQTRFTMTMEDFEKLFDNLEDELNDIVAELEGEDLEDRYSPDLFIVGDLTDTFTGS